MNRSSPLRVLERIMPAAHHRLADTSQSPGPYNIGLDPCASSTVHRITDGARTLCTFCACDPEWLGHPAHPRMRVAVLAALVLSVADLHVGG